MTACAPQDFQQSVREALEHLGDYTYLVQHPLAKQLHATGDGDAPVAVQRLRKLLLDALEQLRPAEGIPLDDPAWRPYRALHARCVLRKGLLEVEHSLGLGRRQIQREQQKGYQAVAEALWNRFAPADDGSPQPAPNQLVLLEIGRTADGGEAYDAREQVWRVTDILRSIAGEHGYTVDADVPDHAVMLPGNPIALRQVLLSLASSVSRATTVRRLRVRLITDEGDAVCEMGFSCDAAPSELPELAESAATLAAAQDIQITHEIGEGRLRVWVRVPTGDRSHAIAVIEDNKDLVSLWSRYLVGKGYRLVDVGPGYRANERIRSLNPALVVLDVMMQGIDGWEVLQQLRADPQLSGIPVLVCTVLDERELALCLGADGYLKKPVRPADFVECLSQLLRSRDS
jgi:CheY-like chemotaxis protein